MKKIIDSSQTDGVFEDVGKDGWYKISLTVDGGTADAGVAVSLFVKNDADADTEERIVAQNGEAVLLTQADPMKLVAIDAKEMIKAEQTGGTNNITVTANRFDK